MKPKENGTGLRTVVVLCLVGLYFVLSMGVTLLGSGIYRSVAAAGTERYTQRTALSYVANQLRRGSAGPVLVGEFGGNSALRLSELADDGSVYVTYIYCCDGQLRELYTAEDSGLLPADGIALMELASLEFETDNGLITVTAGDGDGHRWSVTLAPRTGLEEVGAL